MLVTCTQLALTNLAVVPHTDYDLYQLYTVYLGSAVSYCGSRCMFRPLTSCPVLVSQRC